MGAAVGLVDVGWDEVDATDAVGTVGAAVGLLDGDAVGLLDGDEVGTALGFAVWQNE